MGAERRFHAMGTDVHVVVHGDPAMAALAESLLAGLEARWSRFRPASEVSALNARPGEWVEVSADTLALVSRAVEAARATDGLVDATVLADVVRLGYDRSFEELTTLDAPVPPPVHRTAGAGDIEIDALGGRVRLPVGIGFDPGGIGKGLAADRVAEQLDALGVAGALINVGGDLRAVGYAPAGEDWTVDLDPLRSGTPLARVALAGGAVATSTTERRRWRAGGRDVHHLVDPRTGEPADTGVIAATALAAEGWQAEALAKAAILAGPDRGLDLVEQAGGDGLVLLDDGSVRTSGHLDRFGALRATDDRPPALAATGGHRS